MVATENTDNWRWFLEKLKQHAKHERELMFISNRAGGLLSAFEDVYDKPPNYFCLYHLMKNLRTAYSGKKYSDNFKNHMCKLLKDAAHEPNRRFFDEAIQRFIAKGGDKAKHFLTDLPPQKWVVAFATNDHRYGELTSNVAEFFNSWILDARSLPITFMFDSMRQQLMRWFNERRAESATWIGALTPTMEAKWNISLALGENLTILPTNRHGTFEVLSKESVVVFIYFFCI